LDQEFKSIKKRDHLFFETASFISKQ